MIQWLKGIGLPPAKLEVYIEGFKENDIDASVMDELEKSDLAAATEEGGDGGDGRR